jgi:hypothetical protein
MEPQEHWQQDWEKRRRDGRMTFGIILVAVGLFLILRMFGIFSPIFLSFHFGWPVILVIIGLIIGVKSGFRRNAWWILMLIGGAFMAKPYYPTILGVPTAEIFWPALLVIAGIAVMLRRKDERCEHRWKHHHHHRHTQLLTSDADTVNIDATFGGRKEVITSRNFKGGMIRASFSGVELNLAGAEAGIQPVVLEVYASFAGVEIIIPSHWELQNEIRPTLGSVEDHRVIRTTDTSGERRLLVLRGNCNFGSVEIKSY